MRVIGTVFVKVRCLSAGREEKKADLGRKEDTLEIAVFEMVFVRYCEGCESKKCKIAGCARARTRESPIFTLHFIVIFAPPLPTHFSSHLRA